MNPLPFEPYLPISFRKCNSFKACRWLKAAPCWWGQCSERHCLIASISVKLKYTRIIPTAYSNVMAMGEPQLIAPRKARPGEMFAHASSTLLPDPTGNAAPFSIKLKATIHSRQFDMNAQRRPSTVSSQASKQASGRPCAWRRSVADGRGSAAICGPVHSRSSIRRMQCESRIRSHCGFARLIRPATVPRRVGSSARMVCEAVGDEYESGTALVARYGVALELEGMQYYLRFPRAFAGHFAGRPEEGKQEKAEAPPN